MTSNAVEFRGVGFGYGAGSLLTDVSFDIAAGEFFGIIGPNASGKTSLLKLMLGLLQPDRGQIRVLGKAPVEALPRVGYVPQYPSFSRNIPFSVLELVLVGRLGTGRTVGGFSDKDRDVAHKVLDEMEIPHLAGRRVYTLSGGELQRVLIARALVCEPALLILDEPTANIDIAAEEDVFALLRSHSRRMTIVIVSHDVSFISAYVDRVGCVNRTLVCHDTEALTGGKISEFYGKDVRMIRHAH